jgi:hypothetical protein
MKLAILISLLVVIAPGVHGQFSSENPLEELRSQVAQALEEAGVGLIAEQEIELALFMEEQRQASEDLFGIIMDFRDGPPQGQEQDRAMAAIEWMRDEFRKKLSSFLTDAQRAVWERLEVSQSVSPADGEGRGLNGGQGEIQEVRINNNPFTAEESERGDNNRTQVIRRGGAGAYHGNFAADFQDESLNARNPFADNKPPYQQRTIAGNFSGPLIRNRLTIEVGIDHSRQENVGTVRAETLEGPFSLGITRPNINRNYDARGVYQLADQHSIRFRLQHGSNERKNQGIGDFSLPEHGSNIANRNSGFDLRQFSELSQRVTYETRFEVRNNHFENQPITREATINVLDAFVGGGAVERSETKGRNYQFGNLLYYAGDKWIVRAGVDGWHRRESSLSENNFLGEFTFSDLTSYRDGQPLTYRVTRGDPLLDLSQTQMGFFIQTDRKITPRFTAMFGVRLETQTNLRDRNNFDPRLGFAYALGGATVVRGGIGTFHQRLDESLVRNLLRLDGTRQYELVVENPSWPNPFQSGSVQTLPPSSRRVREPNLVAPYTVESSISLEKSLPRNLFLTLSFEYVRGLKLFRSRNLNAPLRDATVQPNPNEGNIYQLESSGSSSYKNFRAGARQRFSIFSVRADYTLASGYSDTDGAFDLPSNNYDLRADWGRSGSVQRHRFEIDFNSRLPLDVYLTTSISANSGSPYNITTGRDDNNDSHINDRPAGLARNSGNGPGFFNVGFNLSKAFQLRRSPDGSNGLQINFFINADNALNMTNFGPPSGVMTSPLFGKPFRARNPRQVEIGMRFQF